MIPISTGKQMLTCGQKKDCKLAIKKLKLKNVTLGDEITISENLKLIAVRRPWWCVQFRVYMNVNGSWWYVA